MNRKKRRKIQKELRKNKKKITYQQAEKIFSLSDVFESFPEGTKVKIIPKKCVMHNKKRNLFIESHIGQIMTICYDSRYTNNPHIYSLLEDESDPKWLWNHSELEMIKQDTEYSTKD